MNWWVEERVEAIRLALRIEGFPQPADLYRLVDWLGGCLVVRRSTGGRAVCVHREDRRGVITVPRGGSNPEMDHALAEEIGHYLLTCGMADLLRRIDAEDCRIARLARRWEWQEAGLAREFVRAWYLPAPLVRQIPDDEELARRSRCSVELVRERRQSLRGRVPELTLPPRWSAASEYGLVSRKTGAGQVLQVVRRDDAEPLFFFPVRKTDAAPAALQLWVELIALTSTEFELKWVAFRCEPAQWVEPGAEELRAWIAAADPTPHPAILHQSV